MCAQGRGVLSLCSIHVLQCKTTCDDCYLESAEAEPPFYQSFSCKCGSGILCFYGSSSILLLLYSHERLQMVSHNLSIVDLKHVNGYA